MDGLNFSPGSSGAEAYVEKRKVLYNKMLKGEDCTDWYDTHGETFDQEYEKVEFLYPEPLVEILTNLVPDRQAKILDIGAGSGKIAEILLKKGYSNIDALDGSKAMIDILKPKGLYSSYYHCRIDDKKVQEIEDGTYEGLTVGSVFNRGHMNFEALPTLLRMMKKGGFMTFSLSHWNMKFDEFSRSTLNGKLQDLEKRQLGHFVSEKPAELRRGEPASLFTVKRGEGDF